MAGKRNAKWKFCLKQSTKQNINNQVAIEPRVITYYYYYYRSNRACCCNNNAHIITVDPRNRMKINELFVECAYRGEWVNETRDVSTAAHTGTVVGLGRRKKSENTAKEMRHIRKTIEHPTASVHLWETIAFGYCNRHSTMSVRLAFGCRKRLRVNAWKWVVDILCRHSHSFLSSQLRLSFFSYFLRGDHNEC